MLLLSKKRVKDFDAQEWLEYTKNCFKANKGQKTVTSVNGVNISWGEKKVILSVKRVPKEVTPKELEILAVEFKKTYEEIYTLFKSRKIKITGEDYGSENGPKRKRKTSKKRNVEPTATVGEAVSQD